MVQYTWLHKRYQLQCQETPIKAPRYRWHRGHLKDIDIKITYMLIYHQWGPVTITWGQIHTRYITSYQKQLANYLFHLPGASELSQLSSCNQEGACLYDTLLTLCLLGHTTRLVNRTSRSQYYLGCGHFVWLYPFRFQATEGGRAMVEIYNARRQQSWLWNLLPLLAHSVGLCVVLFGWCQFQLFSS